MQANCQGVGEEWAGSFECKSIGRFLLSSTINLAYYLCGFIQAGGLSQKSRGQARLID